MNHKTPVGDDDLDFVPTRITDDSGSLPTTSKKHFAELQPGGLLAVHEESNGGFAHQDPPLGSSENKPKILIGGYDRWQIFVV